MTRREFIILLLLACARAILGNQRTKQAAAHLGRISAGTAQTGTPGGWRIAQTGQGSRQAGWFSGGGWRIGADPEYHNYVPIFIAGDVPAKEDKK